MCNLYVALILGYTQYRIIKGMVNYAALNLIELRKTMLWNKVLMVCTWNRWVVVEKLMMASVITSGSNKPANI
jgi:hypothetical protein